MLDTVNQTPEVNPVIKFSNNKSLSVFVFKDCRPHDLVKSGKHDFANLHLINNRFTNRSFYIDSHQ